jgi:hypothetical protein
VSDAKTGGTETCDLVEPTKTCVLTTSYYVVLSSDLGDDANGSTIVSTATAESDQTGPEEATATMDALSNL